MIAALALAFGGGSGASVPQGGTGVTSFTAYAPIFGGTTATGSLQSGTVGTAGQVLTSNGAGVLPTFQAVSGTGDFTGPASSVNNQLVIFSGTGGKTGKDSSGITAVSGAFAGIVSITGTTGNMTITAGTGNSRTLILQSTTSGGTATTGFTLNADQTIDLVNNVTITKSVNAGLQYILTNANGGTGAYNEFSASNGTGACGFGQLGTAYTTNGALVQGSGYILASAAAGLSVCASNAAGLIRFYAGGLSSERMRIFASGGVSIGNTTDPGAGNLSVTGSGAFTSNVTATRSTTGGQQIINTNANGGTGAYTEITASNGTNQVGLGMLGTGYTTAGGLIQNSAYILNSAAAGLSIINSAAGAIRMYTNNTLAFTLASGGAAAFVSTVTTASGQSIGWNGLSLMRTAVDGNIIFSNGAQTSFGLLQLGGTSSSFPSIKRSSATLAFRLADDSADAGISAAAGIFSGPVRLPGYTVATLPAGTVGDNAYVTDATAPLYNTALTGSGAVVTKVFRNATIWVSA